MKTTFLYIFFIASLIPFFGFGQNAHFINLSREDGLASNFIKVIHQDSYGYMWFGTDYGLNRYDGVNMDTYRNYSEEENSLSSNNIVDILQTSTGKLLVCTTNSIDVFNYNTENFEHITFIGDFDFKGIIETAEGEIWVLSNNNVVNVLNSELQVIHSLDLKKIKDGIHPFKNDVNIFKYDKFNLVLYIEGEGFYLLNLKSKKTSFLSNDVLPASTQVVKIQPISESEFWIVGFSGVFVVKNGMLSHRYKEGNTEAGENLTSNFVLDLKTMPNNEVWLFTDGGGINIYNKITKKFRYIINDFNDKYSITSNFIYTSYVDENSALWVGSIKNGVSLLDVENPFSTYKLINTVNNQKMDVPVSSLFFDSKKQLWVGCDGRGLYKFENNTLKHVLYDETIKTITSINQVAPNVIILGTYKNGVSTYDIVNNKLVKQKHINDQLNLDLKITFIEKENKTFWIGGSKIIRFKEQNNHQLIKPDINFSSNNIRALSYKEYSKNNPFFGTLTGFYKYKNNKFSVISNLSKNIYGICNYGENKYWLATNKGLGLIDVNTKITTFYGTESGLNNEDINSLLAYDSNSLWMGTSQGISEFNTETKKFKNFTYSDGFLDNTFNSLKALKFDDGRLIFGGVKGLLVFHPDSIKTKTKVNKVVFTKLFINHKALPLNEDIAINEPFEEVKQINLKHRHKVITVGFSSFNYEYAKNIKFKYQLEGYSDEWSTTKDRSLTYMNLAPGTYNLKVKASSLSGIWNESYSTLTIKVLPAWWQTIWFKVFIVSLIGFVVFIINRSILKRERLKKAFEFEKKSLNDQKELDEQQLRFFTNLSHEIRTPLSLILSPVETIIKEDVNQKVNNNLSLIKNNALRINRLISRGIDFRKTQFKEPDIQVVNQDIIVFLKGIANAFGNFSSNKNIQLTFNSEVNSLFLWFDAYMVETIVYNLLSNAFKYSYPNSEVLLNITLKEETVHITIQDFGQGIPSEDLHHIFERFYQSKNHIGGSGIGLALTKKFVEAHKGEVKVTSVVGEGSCFNVVFRLGNEHFNKKDLIKIEDKNESGLIEKETQKSNLIFDVKFKNKKVLIVEDETSLRDFLVKNLSSIYTIISSSNGVEAQQVINNQKVDLIISDIMMPEMDGVELCRWLKGDVKKCDIPIIMLTAKTLIEDKIDGYNIGANAYIEKPFQLDLLISRINNLLEESTRQNEKLLGELKITSGSETINNSNHKFYNQVMLIIENHIENSEFNIPMLATELGMSKSLIYKKMAEITDLGINDLILTVRLNKASQMLIHTKRPIAEISSLVGFQNAKYFSTSFKKKFGKTPSKYRAEKIT